jgi:hypothetical protein
LELRRAGYGWPAIVSKLKFTSLTQAQESHARGLALEGWSTVDFASVAEAELDRLNRLQQVVWAKATVDKNPAAIDRAARLGYERVRIAALASKLTGPRIVMPPPSEEAEQPVREVDDLESFRQRHHGSAS